MEKRIKFSDKATVSKIVYLTVIAILCVSAIVIGIVASNSRKNESDVPPATDGGGTGNGGSTDSGNNTDTPTVPEVKLTFVSPAVGTVIKSHSATTPVFSETLEEWRIHTGLDISLEAGAEVYASGRGEVTGVYKDAMLGTTVEITHSDTHKTYYSNLDAQTVAVSIGDSVKQGDLIAKVGDSAVIEIAEEPHLHFELKVNGASVNPLDYMEEDSKKTALGIVSGSEA
jgi:murein DD-endopeptidase MepM/ murein hydrolase activator NlpD